MASRSSNRAAVPEAKGALDKFKYEVANELGVPLSDGYNGDLTSKQNGSVGGCMITGCIEAADYIQMRPDCHVTEQRKSNFMSY